MTRAALLSDRSAQGVAKELPLVANRGAELIPAGQVVLVLPFCVGKEHIEAGLDVE